MMHTHSHLPTSLQRSDFSGIWRRLALQIQNIPVIDQSLPNFAPNPEQRPPSQNLIKNTQQGGTLEMDIYESQSQANFLAGLSQEAFMDLILHTNISDYNLRNYYDIIFPIGNIIASRWTPQMSQAFLDRHPDEWDYQILMGTGLEIFAAMDRLPENREIRYPRRRYPPGPYAWMAVDPDLCRVYATIPRALIERIPEGEFHTRANWFQILERAQSVAGQHR